MKNQEQHTSEQLSFLEKTESPGSNHSVARNTAPSPTPTPDGSPRYRKTIQDLLFPEGLFVVQLSIGASSLDDLQKKLQQEFRQNSVEARFR